MVDFGKVGINRQGTGGEGKGTDLWPDNLDRSVSTMSGTRTLSTSGSKVGVGGTGMVDQGLGCFEVNSSAPARGSSISAPVGSPIIVGAMVDPGRSGPAVRLDRNPGLDDQPGCFQIDRSPGSRSAGAFCPPAIRSTLSADRPDVTPQGKGAAGNDLDRSGTRTACINAAASTIITITSRHHEPMPSCDQTLLKHASPAPSGTTQMPPTTP